MKILSILFIPGFCGYCVTLASLVEVHGAGGKLCIIEFMLVNVSN